MKTTEPKPLTKRDLPRLYRQLQELKDSIKQVEDGVILAEADKWKGKWVMILKKGADPYYFHDEDAFERNYTRRMVYGVYKVGSDVNKYGKSLEVTGYSQSHWANWWHPEHLMVELPSKARKSHVWIEITEERYNELVGIIKAITFPEPVLTTENQEVN